MLQVANPTSFVDSRCSLSPWDFSFDHEEYNGPLTSRSNPEPEDRVLMSPNRSNSAPPLKRSHSPINFATRKFSFSESKSPTKRLPTTVERIEFQTDDEVEKVVQSFEKTVLAMDLAKMIQTAQLPTTVEKIAPEADERVQKIVQAFQQTLFAKYPGLKETCEKVKRQDELYPVTLTADQFLLGAKERSFSV